MDVRQYIARHPQFPVHNVFSIFASHSSSTSHSPNLFSAYPDIPHHCHHISSPRMPLLRPSTRLPGLLRQASTMAQPRFSAGTDAASVTPALKALLTSDGGRWTLAKDGAALERQFKFKTFAKTWVSW